MASLRPQTTADLIRRGVEHMLVSVTDAAAQISVRRKPRPLVPAGTVLLSGALLMGGIALGALLSTQWQLRMVSTASASSPVTRQSDRGIVAATIGRLETEQANLKNQIADLRTELSTAQGSDARRKVALTDISNETTHQRLASGMVALHGPGITAVYDDSTVRSVPENEDPANYILHEYDLRDMLNTLWIAGAEAISVNGERIVGNTSLYCVGTTIICNSTRLSPPYEVRAIGDPATLAAALQNSLQMDKFNQRARIYDLPQKIEQSRDVYIPAYNGSVVFKYATVQGQK